MKKLVAVLALLTGAFGGYAQTGVWSGRLEVQGVKLPLVFHFDDESPCLDSPAQGARGIPMQFERIEPDSVSVSIPAIGGSFAGKLVDGQIVGRFSQMGVTLPLTLKAEEVVIRRPQTPQPPYPYEIDEVSFTNGDARLSGTLTLPQGVTRQTPVVLMVTGSGQQNRDEELFDHKPFAVIADALARNGIASLRYDDRGFGESTGEVVNCTTEDFKNDALAGVDFLRILFDNVGVLGHSEGGTIALMLAADGKCDFIVSLAGMVISGAETLMEQNKMVLAQAGYPQEVIDEYLKQLALAFNGYPATSMNLPEDLAQNLDVVLLQLSYNYLRYFVNLDPRKRLQDVKCPVLALNGSKDLQVLADLNLPALKAGLPANEANQIVELEGLNHLFQHCETGYVGEYGTIEETISPEVLTRISKWINSLNFK